MRFIRRTTLISFFILHFSHLSAQDFQTIKSQYELGLPDKRAQAAEKLAEYKTAESLAVLRQAALSDSDKGVRLAAIGALAGFPRRDAAETIMRAMGDTDADVRKKARGTILSGNPETAFQELVNFLPIARKDTALSYEALGALADADRTKAVGIFETLVSDNDNIRFALARLMPVMGATESSARITEKFLADELPEIRTAAADSAARLKLYTLTGKIIPLITDKNPAVRAAAEDSLGKLAAKESLIYWFEAFDHPDARVRKFAVEKVCNIGDPGAMPHVFSMLDDKSKDVRETAAAGIPSIFSREHVFFMINELGARNRARRKTALGLLGGCGDSAVLPALFSAMQKERDREILEIYHAAISRLARSENLLDIRLAVQSKDSDVRISAVRALAAISSAKYSETFSIFLNHVKKEKDPAVQKEILAALEKMNPVPYRLAYAWTTGQNNEVKIQTAEFLAKHGEIESIHPLMDAADDSNQEVSWRAREAVEKLVKNPSDAVELSTHLSSKKKPILLFVLGIVKKFPSKNSIDNLSLIEYAKADQEVRYAMIEAVRALKPNFIHPLVLEALKDKNGEIRWLASKTAGEIETASLPAEILSSLSDPSPAVREETLKMLARNPRADYEPRIAPLLGDADVSVKRAALSAIENIAGEESVKRIQTMLADTDAAVRAAAARITGKAKSSSATAALKKMAETDFYPDCRREAASALYRIGAIDEKTVEIYFLLLKDSDSSVRETAAGILNNVLNKSHKPHILKALYSDNPHSRAYALGAIGRLNLYEVNPELFNLVKLMRKENKKENQEMLSTLAALLDENDVPELANLYEMNNPELKLWVISRLGKMKSEAAINLMTRAMREENPAFRQKAVEALPDVFSPRLRAALKHIADNDPDPVLRKLATDKIKK